MSKLKFAPLSTIIAICIGALVGWTFYELGNASADLFVLALVTGFISAVFLTGMMGTQTDSRVTVSIRVLSGLFLTLSMIVDIIFACYVFSVPLFLIANISFILIWVYIFSALIRRVGTV